VAHFSKGIGLITAILLLAMANFRLPYSYYPPVLSISLFMLMLIEIGKRQITGKSNALWNLGATISGVIFIIFPWLFIYLLRVKSYGIYVLLTLFICTWTCDVFAYIIGSKWGHNCLCEKVSPHKSWEGFWGGLAGAMLGSIFIPYFYGLPPVPYLLIGAICGIAGQFGDLGESILKREAGVKDSGAVIPGHGGFLDRFDSILISGTITYLIFGVILG
jgi:phosphatidate cytidylyltransferase